MPLSPTHTILLPGAAVVEFQTLESPPLMFWNNAQALGQDYWMVTVPGASWADYEMQVPIEDVVATVDLALRGVQAGGYALRSGYGEGRGCAGGGVGDVCLVRNRVKRLSNSCIKFLLYCFLAAHLIDALAMLRASQAPGP